MSECQQIHLKKRKGIKKKFNELPFRVVINEILGKFYEVDESKSERYFHWWLFEGYEYDVDKLKEEINIRKLKYWRGREQKLIDGLLLPKKKVYEDTNKRIKLIYGYFSCDRFRKPFLVFRNYKFHGCGYRRKLLYPIDIKGMKSLKFVDYSSELIGNREYKTLERLHIVKSSMTTESFNVIKNLKKLVLDNYRFIKKIEGWSNLEVLELIECDWICEVKDCENLKRLSIKTHLKPWRSNSIPTQLTIEDLPKIEKLKFIQTRETFFINISNEIIKSVKCLELVDCNHHFEEIKDWCNLEELICNNGVVKQVKDLSKLKVLKVFGLNRIKILGNLKSLEVLRLDRCPFHYVDKTTMDNAIKATKVNKTAYIWVEQLRDWNNEYSKFLELLKNVKHLEIRKFSGKLENLNKLEFLKLNYSNGIWFDTDEIKNLKKLKKLKIIFSCYEGGALKQKCDISNLPSIEKIGIINAPKGFKFNFTKEITEKCVIKML